MADKHIFLDSSGLLTEREAIVASVGAGDSGKHVALDNTGKLDNSVLPTGIGAEVQIAPASENLAAGDLVSFWNDAGTLRVRKADASSANAGRRAHGFVTAAVNSGVNATVYTDAGTKNSNVSGLTPGTQYFLSGSTAGGLTANPPTTAGHCIQPIGVATSATAIVFSPGNPIIRA